MATAKLSELGNAASALDLAMEPISDKSLRLEFEETVIDFYSDAYPIFEKAIALQYQIFQIDTNQDHIEHAFLSANQCKAIALQQDIRRSHASIYQEIPPAKLDTLTKIRIRLRKLQMKQSKWIDAGQTYKSDSVASISSLVNNLLKELNDYESELDQTYPNYRKLKEPLKPTGSEIIFEKILGPETCLLQYFIGDEKLFIFTLSNEQLRLHQIELDFPLVQLVENFRTGITDYFINSVKEKEDTLYIKCAERYADSALEIYTRIWKPVNDYLKPNVIIVTDGIIGALPFDAILTSPLNRVDRFKTLPYLIRSYNISYKVASNFHEFDRAVNNKAVDDLVMSPFDVSSAEVNSLLKSTIHPLKYSYAEAEKIHDIIKGIWLKGENATKINFIKYCSFARILHIATHSQADLDQNDLSYLAFQSLDNQDIDYLYAGDIYNLTLNADMVMLSACETGIGHFSRSEGMMSLARAFLHSNAQSVCSSLWKINDEKTSQLMIESYQLLAQRKSKDKALQLAKLKLISTAPENIDAHPFFWAAFVGIGEMKALKKFKN
ncbi:MAG: CHAT domain-containing protein [Saprospiraceae bacterium]|nr:CHAT domain-containing protein [Saprospiraceae bacterium]